MDAGGPGGGWVWGVEAQGRWVWVVVILGWVGGYGV